MTVGFTSLAVGSGFGLDPGVGAANNDFGVSAATIRSDSCSRAGSAGAAFGAAGWTGARASAVWARSPATLLAGVAMHNISGAPTDAIVTALATGASATDSAIGVGSTARATDASAIGFATVPQDTSAETLDEETSALGVGCKVVGIGVCIGNCREGSDNVGAA